MDSYSGIEAGPDRPTGRLTLFDDYVDLLSRSHCVYINRAVETWDRPPDFAVIQSNMAALSQRSARPYVFGEFIAESVPLNQTYYYPAEHRNFDFTQMCKAPPKPGAKDCTPSFDRPEYQKYVAYVARNSIDIGVQVLLFGGVALTDPKGTVNTSNLTKIIHEMKAYGADKGITVLVIAQSPSTFGGAPYLADFDLIQGGAYINEDGSLPETAAVTNKGDARAPARKWLVKNPGGTPLYDPHKLVSEYDWYGNPLDDSSEIACLSIKTQSYLDNIRAQSAANCPEGRVVDSAVAATRKTYEYFKSMGSGFWLPGRQPIGFAPWIYTPLNLELYKQDPRFAVNFNDEGILSIPPLRQPGR